MVHVHHIARVAKFTRGIAHWVSFVTTNEFSLRVTK